MRSVPISQVKPGAYRVAAITGSREAATRLYELGMRVGIEVRVFGNHGSAGLVVGCGDTRLALDGDASSGIRVVSEGV